MLPLSYKIYRVSCNFCKIPLGHIILDNDGNETQALNRAQSTFPKDTHNSICQSQRRQNELVDYGLVYDFSVELI